MWLKKKTKQISKTEVVPEISSYLWKQVILFFLTRKLYFVRVM